jgi:hypothetical protein
MPRLTSMTKRDSNGNDEYEERKSVCYNATDNSVVKGVDDGAVWGQVDLEGVLEA